MRELEQEPEPPEGLIAYLRRVLKDARATAVALEPKSEALVIGQRRTLWRRKRPILFRCTWREWGTTAVLWLYCDRQMLGSVVIDKRLGTFQPQPKGVGPTDRGPARKQINAALYSLVFAGGLGQVVTVGQVEQLGAAIKARLWQDESEGHSVSDNSDVSSGGSK